MKSYKILFTTRKSNQIKFSDEELASFRQPIDKLLLDNGFSSNRIANMDESSVPKTFSHQRGSFTTEGQNLENFKASCINFIMPESDWLF